MMLLVIKSNFNAFIFQKREWHSVANCFETYGEKVFTAMDISLMAMARPGPYACPSQIARGVAAMDSCFALFLRLNVAWPDVCVLTEGKLSTSRLHDM